MLQMNSVFIPVTDIKQSKKWYELVLGLIKVDEGKNGSDHGVGYIFPKGNTGLALIKVEEPQSTSFKRKGSHPNVFFNFSTDDIEGDYQRLLDKNVITTPIQHSEEISMFDFKDPDGNSFSVVQEAPQSPYHENHIKALQRQHSKY